MVVFTFQTKKKVSRKKISFQQSSPLGNSQEFYPLKFREEISDTLKEMFSKQKHEGVKLITWGFQRGSRR